MMEASSIRQYKQRRSEEDEPSTTGQHPTKRVDRHMSSYLAVSLLVAVVLLNTAIAKILMSGWGRKPTPKPVIRQLPHNHEKTARGNCQTQPAHALQPNVNFDYFKGVHNIEFARTHYQQHMQKVPKYEDTSAVRSWGKGVVYVTGYAHFNSTLLSLRMLRGYGCHLPVEVWHLSGAFGDLTLSQVEEFQRLGAVVRDLSAPTNYKPVKVLDLESSEFLAKPAAMLNSAFSDFLFLDSDTVPTTDPTYLFSLPQFQETGAVFWTDVKRTHQDNPIYKIFNVRCYDELELDNGQFLMNKKKVWDALHAAAFMVQNYDYFSQLLFTDKDTYRFACKATDTAYHVIRHPASVVGFTTAKERTFCGHTFGQKDPAGKIVFLHMWVFKAVEESESDFNWHFVNEGGHTWNGFSASRPWTAVQHAPDPKLETSYVALGRLPDSPEVPCLQMVAVNRKGRKEVVQPQDFVKVVGNIYPYYDEAGGPHLAENW